MNRASSEDKPNEVGIASEPILVAHLFRPLSRHLLTLLRGLEMDDWHRPTSSSERNVKDIAAHLLDGSLRRLSLQRDGYMAPDTPKDFDSYAELMAYLNRLNADWTTALRRLSPRILLEWLERADAELADLFEQLDPLAPAIFPVAWAGESTSANWFDVAREYTEKWHHQQQIHDALGGPSPIITRQFYYPCLDTFMRALPFAFRDVPAPDNSLIVVRVTGEAGGEWYLLRNQERWVQVSRPTDQPSTTFTIGSDSAWKLLTKRFDRPTALARFPDITIEGNRDLGEHILDMTSVMA